MGCVRPPVGMSMSDIYPDEINRNKFETDYRQLLQDIMLSDEIINSRTGVCAVKYNTTLEHDLRNGFPLITGRKMFWKNVWAEAEWMLRGETSINYLRERGVTIWDQFADADGHITPSYGVNLMADWGDMVAAIKEKPYSRRHVITLWREGYAFIDKLPPCYTQLQFYVTSKPKMYLNLVVTSRSSDAAVGLPYDFAVLAYLLARMASYTGIPAALLTFNSANSHINGENAFYVKQYLEQKMWPLPALANYGNDQPYQVRNYEGNHGPHIPMVVKP
jgi:thymidylate synthase